MRRFFEGCRLLRLTFVLRKRETSLGTETSHLALVVEADEMLRMRVADALVTRGYIVHTSASAEAAAELTLQVAFGLLIVGPTTLAAETPAVRALLRHEGTRQAVVFQHDHDNAHQDGIPADALVRLAKTDDIAAKLRMRVPAAGAADARPRRP